MKYLKSIGRTGIEFQEKKQTGFCLTSRGSAVRTRVLPQKPSSLIT